MTSVTSVEMEWGGARRLFHLDIPRLKALQESRNSGPPEILRRLADGSCRVEDVQETIRLGLIGGKVEPQEASRLVSLYVDERPLTEGIVAAMVILGAAIMGNEPNPERGNAEAVKPDRKKSTSPRSKQAR